MTRLALALAACLLALVYHFHAGRDSGWVRRVGLPAFWFGAALLTKASALAFGPLCLVIVECDRLMRGGTWVGLLNRDAPRLNKLPVPFRPFVHDFVHILAGGLLLTFLYCGSDWQPQPSFVAWARQLPEGLPASVMIWLAEHLCIFSNAGEALVRQIGHNFRGHGVYLLGHADPRSIWYYFPAALSMKLSLPLLVLPLLLAVLRPRCLVNWACLAAGSLLVYSLNCKVQIGVRFMLPLLALAAVGLAAAIVQTWRAYAPSWRRHGLTVVVAGGLAWTALAAVSVWPHGLCYTNEFWGGTTHGYWCLSDSNYDWGQGLKELARWRQKQCLDELDVWYFGADPAVTRPPIRQVPLHLPPVRGEQDVRERVRGKYLAVSTTMLYGNPGLTAEHRRAAAYLHRLRPIDRTTTFLIFDFSEQMSRR